MIDFKKKTTGDLFIFEAGERKVAVVRIYQKERDAKYRLEEYPEEFRKNYNLNNPDKEPLGSIIDTAVILVDQD